MSAISAANLNTPSKKVAASLAAIDVNHTPSKKGSSTDDFSDEPSFLAKGVASAKAAAAQAAGVDSTTSTVATTTDSEHGKFVGDVDLPEEEEPLLVESSRRFVLFPIRYHEVSHATTRSGTVFATGGRLGHRAYRV